MKQIGKKLLVIVMCFFLVEIDAMRSRTQQSQPTNLQTQLGILKTKLDVLKQALSVPFSRRGEQKISQEEIARINREVQEKSKQHKKEFEEQQKREQEKEQRQKEEEKRKQEKQEKRLKEEKQKKEQEARLKQEELEKQKTEKDVPLETFEEQAKRVERLFGKPGEQKGGQKSPEEILKAEDVTYKNWTLAAKLDAKFDTFMKALKANNFFGNANIPQQYEQDLEEYKKVSKWPIKLFEYQAKFYFIALLENIDQKDPFDSSVFRTQGVGLAWFGRILYQYITLINNPTNKEFNDTLLLDGKKASDWVAIFINIFKNTALQHFQIGVVNSIHNVKYFEDGFVTLDKWIQKAKDENHYKKLLDDYKKEMNKFLAFALKNPSEPNVLESFGKYYDLYLKLLEKLNKLVASKTEEKKSTKESIKQDVFNFFAKQDESLEKFDVALQKQQLDDTYNELMQIVNNNNDKQDFDIKHNSRSQYGMFQEKLGIYDQNINDYTGLDKNIYQAKADFVAMLADVFQLDIGRYSFRENASLQRFAKNLKDFEELVSKNVTLQGIVLEDGDTAQGWLKTLNLIFNVAATKKFPSEMIGSSETLDNITKNLDTLKMQNKWDLYKKQMQQFVWFLGSHLAPDNKIIFGKYYDEYNENSSSALSSSNPPVIEEKKPTSESTKQGSVALKNQLDDQYNELMQIVNANKTNQKFNVNNRKEGYGQFEDKLSIYRNSIQEYTGSDKDIYEAKYYFVGMLVDILQIGTSDWDYMLKDKASLKLFAQRLGDYTALVKANKQLQDMILWNRSTANTCIDTLEQIFTTTVIKEFPSKWASSSDTLDNFKTNLDRLKSQSKWTSYKEEMRKFVWFLGDHLTPENRIIFGEYYDYYMNRKE